MRKYFILLAAGFISCYSIQLQAQSLYFDFTGTLAERYGASPDLNQLGTGSFVDDSLSELSCLSRSVYNFPYNDGIQFDNAAAGNFLGETWSIEMYFKFLSNGSFKRVIDFKNQSQDQGVYATDVQLGFYDGIDIPTVAFGTGQYVYLCITRDSASQNVNIYIDGAFGGSFIDSLERGTIDNSQVLNFFRDDLVFGGEAGPGNIAFLKLHNFEISSSQVAASFSSLKDTMHLLSFTQDISGACLPGNIVNFTNTSENDTTVVSYLWDFGNGISQAGINSSYSYPAPGSYTVALIGTDGTGCIDSSLSQVDIYALPIVNLGPDMMACAGDLITLDAGGPFQNYQWNNGSTTQTISPVNSGTFIVTVTDVNGCSGGDTISVTINPVPTFVLPGDTTICAGDSVELTGTPLMSSYLWSTGDTTQIIFVSLPGVYAGIVTDSNGCSATDTIEVTVNSLPVVDLGNDTSYCQGGTLTLDAGPGFLNYTWHDNSSAQTFDVLVSGSFYVEVRDALGCTGSDTIQVTILPGPMVDLGPDTTICGGTLFTLDAGAGQSGYLWNDGSTTQTIDVSVAGTYLVTVTDSNGCIRSDNITLTATPSINLGGDFVTCDGAIIVLDAGGGLATYNWSTGGFTQTISVSATGTYWVEVTDGNGCENADTINITFSANPVVDLGLDQSLCENDTIILDAGLGFSNYLWDDGTGLSTLVVTQSGTYNVTVSDLAGCTGTDDVHITFNPNPVVTLYGDTTLCAGDTLVLDADTIFAGYLWSDGSFDHFITVTTAGTYWVEVANIFGCVGSDTIVVDFYAAIPVPTITQINSNTLESSSPTGNQWYQVPGGLIPGATGQTYSPPQNGTFYVIVTDLSGCQSEKSPDFIFINTGLDNIEGVAISIYPNPASEVLHIVTSGIREQKIQVKVVDLAGRIIFVEEFDSNKKQQVDISNLAAGTYNLLLQSGTVTQSKVFTVAD